MSSVASALAVGSAGPETFPGTVDPGTAGVVAFGVILLALSAWSWAGRSSAARWWVGTPYGRELMLSAVPGLGLLGFSGGLGTVLGGPAGLWLAPAFVVGGVLGMAGPLHVLPGWWGPRWYRQLPPEMRRPDVARSALAAAAAGYFGPSTGLSSSEARNRFGRSKAFGSWGAGWVYDPHGDERAHAMARRGTIQGRLTLYPRRLVFAASSWEDRLRGESTVLAIDRDEISQVRVVPARAGADGVPQSGRLYRSWFPRLVVETPEQVYVFDVGLGRARHVAELLAGDVRASR